MTATTSRAVVALAVPVLAFSMTACGGMGSGGKAAKPAAAAGPTRAEDRAAVEQVLLAYGAATGAKSCDYLARNEITHLGGITGCQHKNGGLSAAIFKVETVAVKGDTANAAIRAGGHTSYYELVREDRSKGIAGGWKISSFPRDGFTRGSRSATPSAVRPAQPAAGDEAEVRRLLTDFGRARGGDLCKFFSAELIAKRGGLRTCQKFFATKPALDGEIVFVRVTLPVGKQDVIASARAILKSRVSGQSLFLGLNRTGSPSGAYAGWQITRQG
jgi:hypothetical protein